MTFFACICLALRTAAQAQAALADRRQPMPVRID